MPTQTIMLVDNGSSRPESTLSLRHLAIRLAVLSGQAIHPVSLQHAHRVEASRLGDRPADTFTAFVRRHLEQGDRQFLVLPLFFGNSRALTAYIPDQVAELAQVFGTFELRQADVIFPLPIGEPRLARILCENLNTAARSARRRPKRVILVDHGSPIPEITAVRRGLATQMRECLDVGVEVSEAVMERREGENYDFNGRLLLEVLRTMAIEQPDTTVFLSLLFLNPGRHAGVGGDIDEICRQVSEEFPGIRIVTTPLVGEHPGLVDILLSRLKGVAGDVTPP